MTDNPPPPRPAAEPRARLVAAFRQPLDNAVAAARTCYSPRIVTPEEVAGLGESDPGRREERRRHRDRLARELYQAGHHTVFEHAHFQFALAGVSRQFVWSFLHSHPFYNSEQVSQRYVPVREGSYFVPRALGEAASALFRETVGAQFAAYERLRQLLVPHVEREYFMLFPARRRQAARYARAIEKKAMEVARYVLPVATCTHLYHTISGLTLLRYRRICRQLDAPDEQQAVVDAMVAAVLAEFPEFGLLLEEPLAPESLPEWPFAAAAFGAGRELAVEARREFDASLDGKISRLVSMSADAEGVLAQAVREVLGVPRRALEDAGAIGLVLDPGRNRLLGEPLNLTSMHKLGRALAHVSFTFRKRLSHTADSQDQRHRMTPGSRPLLAAHLSTAADYVVPGLIAAHPELGAPYGEAMAAAWRGIERLLACGAAPCDAAYLLPNAVPIRFTESAPLDALWHKHRMRLCYNAQEEIWRASVEEAQQIREAAPLIGRHLLPPCGVRRESGAAPLCPEGARYCGVRVWELALEEYRRVI